MRSLTGRRRGESTPLACTVELRRPFPSGTDRLMTRSAYGTACVPPNARVLHLVPNKPTHSVACDEIVNAA